MNQQDFQEYKDTMNKIIQVLIDDDKSRMLDVKILFNMIMGFPECVDTKGHYIYKGQFYDKLSDMPYEGRKELAYRYGDKCDLWSTTYEHKCHMPIQVWRDVLSYAYIKDNDELMKIASDKLQKYAEQYEECFYVLANNQKPFSIKDFNT